MESVLKSLSTLSIRESFQKVEMAPVVILEDISAQLDHFIGSTEAFDDITLLAAKSIP